MATLNENITRIENAKEAIKASITAKGITVEDNAKIDTYASKIDEIGSNQNIVLVRILKNGLWLEGDQNLKVGERNLLYAGKGLYEGIITEENANVLLDGQYVGKVKNIRSEQILSKGNPETYSFTKSGEELQSIASPLGGRRDWIYDSSINGMISPQGLGMNFGNVSVTFDIPASSFKINIGLSANGECDYGVIEDGSGNEIIGHISPGGWGILDSDDEYFDYTGASFNDGLKVIFSNNPPAEAGRSSMCVRSISYEPIPEYPTV